MSQPNQKTITVTNSKSTYYNQKGKLINLLPDEKAEVFLLDEEVIVILNLSDINLNQTTFKPQSRKDLYDYMQKPTTSRTDLIKTISQLVTEQFIIFKNGYSLANLTELLENQDIDKFQLVDEFRTLRDQGKFEFNLTGFKHPQTNQRNRNNNFQNKNYRK